MIYINKTKPILNDSDWICFQLSESIFHWSILFLVLDPNDTAATFFDGNTRTRLGKEPMSKRIKYNRIERAFLGRWRFFWIDLLVLATETVGGLDREFSGAKPKPPAPKKAAKKAAPPKKAAKKDKGYKNASSAYMFFAKANRPNLVKANPDASFGEVGKLIGKAWGDLSDKDKAPYSKLADKDKVRAAKDKAAAEKKK